MALPTPSAQRAARIHRVDLFSTCGTAMLARRPRVVTHSPRRRSRQRQRSLAATADSARDPKEQVASPAHHESRMGSAQTAVTCSTMRLSRWSMRHAWPSIPSCPGKMQMATTCFRHANSFRNMRDTTNASISMRCLCAVSYLGLSYVVRFPRAKHIVKGHCANPHRHR